MMHNLSLPIFSQTAKPLTHHLTRPDAATTDLELLERARGLEAGALAVIHQRFYDPIYRYVAFRVPDRETAEDLASDVFMRLVDALHAGQAPKHSLRGWLFGVAYRVVQDHFRQHYRAPHVALEDHFEAPAGDLDAALDDEAFRAKLAVELERLTEDQLSVLAMRFGAELPIQRVAEALGKTEGAVKQLQARAVATLGRRLMQEAVR